MGSFTIATLAGRVVAELPLSDAALDLVAGDLLQRLPPLDTAGGVPRLLLGPRELGWSERLADLALAPGAVVNVVLLPEPEKAAADLMGTDGTSVRLAAARALHAMGAAAGRQAEALADAVLSDPDAEVVDEALQDARELCLNSFAYWFLGRQLKALLARCDASPGQAVLRGSTVLRRLAPLDPESAGRHEPLLAEPLDDPRSEVRLASVAVLGLENLEDADNVSKLCGALLSDECPDVRRRAAATLGRACRLRFGTGLQAGHLAAGLERARAALAAEVEALRTSASPADRCRMEAVEALQEPLS